MFHLTTHAFFKALLFLAAGSVIHALHGEQDLSAMGGLRKSLPWTHLAFLTGTLAIVGAPPFSGFFSKEEILSVILARSPILFPLMWLVYILTAIYMFRLYFLCFWSDYRGKGKPHESAWTMRLSMAALSVLTLCGGVLNLPDAFGGKKMLKAFLAQSVLDMPSALVDAQTEWMLAALTAIVVAALGGLCYWYYVSQKRRIVSEEKLNWAAKLSYRKFYVDEIYDRLFVRPFAWLSETGLAFFDRRAIDPTLRLFGRASFSAGSVLRYVQNGGVNMYILLMSLGAALILLFGVLAK
jgi:NADH-quinone oxidoreductase subunit L